MIEFPTSPVVFACTTFKNATAYTSSQKLLNKSAMHAVISLLLQSRKFWWYLLLTSPMLLHDVRMTSYCCQQYAECLQFQHDSVPAHRDAHVQQLNCCVKKHQTFLRPTCSLQTAQISVLWIMRSGLSCSIVSATEKSIVWMNWNSGSSMSGAVLNSRFLTRLLTSGKDDIEHMSMLKEDTSSTAYELIMLVLSMSVKFNVTCLTVTSLITKSCQQRWPIHSCSFYKVVHQQIWGMVVDFRVHLVTVNFCLQQWKNY